MRKQMLAIVLVLMLGLCGCSDNKMPQTKEPTEETTGITKTAEVENTESFLSSESKQARYRYAIDSLQAQKIYKKYRDMIDERYESLDEADKKTVWYKPTEKAKEYRAYESEMRQKMYAEIAERCEEYDRKHKNRDLER